MISASILVVLSPTCWSLENPSIGSPIGGGTVPPSSYETGLVPSINPIDTSGNLVVTGNVAGGRHFRGIVPYRGTTDFVASPGSLRSTSGYFDSFLRRSSSVEYLGGYTGRTRPYYSPTGTVTTTVPGGATVFRAPTVGLGGITGETVSGLDLPAEQISYVPERLVFELGNRPMSMTRSELERLIPSEVLQYPQGGEDVSGQEQAGDESFLRDFQMQYQRPPATGQEIGEQYSRFLPPADGSEPNRGAWRGYASQDGEERAGTVGELSQFANTLDGVWGMDVYDQMRRQAGTLPEDIAELYGLGRIERTTGVLETSGQLEAGSADLGFGVTRGETDVNSGVTGVSQVGLSEVKAPALPSRYTSFAALSKDKFNQHMRAAESYMKQGRYYRAADAYTLASLHKRGDPLAYAGKSQALFAAGEYMSSALFLSRALEIFPGYAKMKIDIVEMVGDQDKVENRVADIREWLKISKAGELEFLLGYVYFQLGRLEFAKRSIDSASEKMPDSVAVQALKQAIYERIASL